MTNLSKFQLTLSVTAAIIVAGFNNQSHAQGYYYPQQSQYQQPQYYPQSQPQQHPYYQQQRQYQQQPQYQQQRAAPHERESQAPKKRKDISAQQPPNADISTITGPFVAYTWDFHDTLKDLAAAAGISPNQLLALNDLSMSQLRDGQVLKLPELSTSKSLDIKTDPLQQLSREVWRGVRGKKRVALTFDAGGEPDGLDLLLKNLTDHKAAATFFMTGKFAKDHPSLAQEITKVGYKIHNHSWSHPEFTKLSDAEIGSELSKTDDQISSWTLLSTKPYWRPPFGDRNDRVLKQAAVLGYCSIYWTLDTLDSVGDKKSADAVVNRIFSPPNAKANPDHFLDGAIILMHVGEVGTANAVPRIISGLRERGFTLVTVEEILQP